MPTITHNLIVKGKEYGIKELPADKPEQFNDVYNQIRESSKKTRSKLVGENEIIAFKMGDKEEDSKYSTFI